MSFKRILCPIDFSPSSTLVLRHALGLASGPDASVRVLHVVEPLLVQAAMMAGTEDGLRTEVTDALRRVIDEATGREDVPARIVTEVVAGEPHAAILDGSANEACDLIVMGTHGASGLAKAWFGSTLERVLRLTMVPVVAIPPRGIGLLADRTSLAVTTIVAAVDFGQPSMAAACAAASYARRMGARLTLLHVVPEPSFSGWQQAASRQLADRRQRAEHELAQLAEELSNGGPPTTIAVLDGQPWECIAHYGGDRTGTLVVMGLGRDPGPSAGRPGSVAYRVLSTGGHPVLVVPSTISARAAA
jgi:nucleotide-binding universal stress UspA family protein